MFPTAPSCISTNRPGHGQDGSAILFIIISILLMGIVGAGMSRLFSSGTVETAVSTPAPNVQYVTEAGYRLVASEFNAAADGDKQDVLEDMHGKTFVLDQASGSQVTVNIHSYWFRITSVSGTTITVESLSEIPPLDFDNPNTLINVASAPKISINRSQPLTVTSITTDTSGSQHTAVITLSAAPPLAETGDSVYLAQDSSGSVSISGDDLVGLPADFAFFPKEKGQFYLYDGNDTVYEYDSMDTNSDGTVNLRGVTNLSGKSSSDFRNQDFIMLKTLAMSCTGQYGSSSLAATRTETYYSRLDSDADAEIPVQASPNFVLDAGFDDFENGKFEDWESNSNVTKQSYQSAQGSHVSYAAVEDPDPTYDWQNRQYIKEEVMCLDKNAEFAEAWEQSSNSLSYDVQVKIGSGFMMLYGTMGLSIKHHEASNNRDQAYGVSVMKYYNWTGSNWSSYANYNDYIPDSIKPPNMGTDVDEWRWQRLGGSHSNYEARMPCECTVNCNQCEPRDFPQNPNTATDKILIVFWKQYVENGRERRVWMAYKDITDDYYTMGKQWYADGRVVNDNFSLVVRAEERMMNGKKTSFIKVFYGDASDEYPTSGSRTTNAIAYDIRNLRGKYIPSWDTGGDDDFPTWPPYDTDSWNATIDDMTFIRKAPDSYATTRGKVCTWDDVNGEVSSDFTIMWDGGTIRSREFLTPDDDYPTDRKEICLHAYYDPYYDGGVNFANEAATFDDFNLRVYYYQ